VAAESQEIQDAVPRLVPCLLCGQMDGVVRVPVVHDEACEEYKVRGHDRYNLPVPAGGSRLIDELAVVPRAQKWVGRGVGAGAAALFGVIIGGNLVRVGTADAGAFASLAAGLLVCAAFAAAWTLGAVGVVKRQRRLARGLASAEEIWRHGWYCRRCDVVYFQPGYAPAGVDPRTPLDTGEFRRIVFAAGGYADLA
jgi:hypothetical protein